MTGMARGLAWLVLGVLSLTHDSRTDQIQEIQPPQNFSLSWIDDLTPKLTWLPPQHSTLNCIYQLANGNDSNENLSSLSWNDTVNMEGGSLTFSIKTICNGKTSEPAVIRISYPEMVKNIECYMISSQFANCSWETASPAASLRFFYRYGLVREFNMVENDNLVSPYLQECQNYSYTGDTRTGCELRATIHHHIKISINGTVNNTLFRNTFLRMLWMDVRLPPLEWTVNKTQNKFLISWNPPNISCSDCNFIINYTECDSQKQIQLLNRTSGELNRVRHCPYRMTLHAEKDNFRTQPSKEYCFDADTDNSVLVYAAVFIPLMFTGLIALTFTCCRRNKEYIFPKVPKPRDLLSDISNNNNKRSLCNLYVPAQEEENCKITLVTDPQIDKPDH